jgi:hypothetical protein
MCITAAAYSLHYSNQYDAISNNIEYKEIARNIKNINEIEKLRSITLQLHQNTMDDTIDNRETMYKSFETWLALSFMVSLIIYFYNKDNVSNKSSNLTGAKDVPPS